MNTVIIVYSILLSLLVGGYIVLLFEVRELKRFNDVFVKFMKAQQELNNSQVEHNKNVYHFVTLITNEIGQALGKEKSDVRESDCVDGES